MMYRNRDFGNKYIVRSDGVVTSNVSNKTLKPFGDGKRGYLKVKLYDIYGIPCTISLHRLIIETHLPIDNYQDMEVDHIDGNIFNNRLDNLRWVSRKENLSHKGKFHHKQHLRRHRIKVCEMYFRDGFSMVDISRYLDIDQQSISDFLKGKSYKNFSKDWCFLNKIPYPFVD